jgi:methyltransferase (TIGR00027 family)
MPEPDASAVEAALQRGAHQYLDDPPCVLEDDVGRQLVAPAAGWLDRFRPEGVRRVRASQIGRARFIEDFVVKRLAAGVQQYVLLGAGLDSFALRHPSLSARLHVFEVDVPTTQSWKQQRLNDLGLAVPPNLRFVPFDFQSDGSWVQALVARGFDVDRPAVVSMLGLSQYISSEATCATMHEVAQLGAGTAFACTFLVPVDFVPETAERATRPVAAQNLADAGHPWVSSSPLRSSLRWLYSRVRRGTARASDRAHRSLLHGPLRRLASGVQRAPVSRITACTRRGLPPSARPELLGPLARR